MFSDTSFRVICTATIDQFSYAKIQPNAVRDQRNANGNRTGILQTHNVTSSQLA